MLSRNVALLQWPSFKDWRLSTSNTRFPNFHIDCKSIIKSLNGGEIMQRERKTLFSKEKVIFLDENSAQWESWQK